MPNKKRQSKFHTATRVTAALFLGGLLTISTHLGSGTATAVGSTCKSITDCTNQINDANNQVSSLRNEAVSYKDAISRLSSDIRQKQNEIAYNQSEQARIEKEIIQKQQDIDAQKNVLKIVIQTMYEEDQMSIIETLAVSPSLSAYVDKETYRNSVQNSLQGSLDQIAKAQAELRVQKDRVASLLSQQRNQASQLSSAQSQQSNLLDYNQSQQVSYNALSAANKKKLDQLIAAQRSANNSSKGGYYFIRFPGTANKFNPANYPYKNAGFSMSTAPGCNDNDGPDKWGYCTRQCVSYAAWAVEASGRKAPRYWSDAKKWVNRAKAAGIYVSNVPQAGDVAISTSGNWGHAMYVESVSGNYINVSQYNQDLTGRYSTQSRKWQ